MSDRFYQQFRQTYIDCVQQIYEITDREDFQLYLNYTKDLESFNKIILEYSESSSKAITGDIGTLFEEPWSPFKHGEQEANLLDAWNSISEDNQKVIFQYLKMLSVLSGLCVVPKIDVDDKPVSDKPVSNKKKRRKKKKKKKKNKEESIESVKSAFKGIGEEGEGIMSDMIDSIVTELNDTSESKKSKMTEKERIQMNALGGMLNMDTSQIEGVFGVAKKISSEFQNRLQSDAVDSNQLLNVAQNLLQNIKK